MCDTLSPSQIYDRGITMERKRFMLYFMAKSYDREYKKERWQLYQEPIRAINEDEAIAELKRIVSRVSAITNCIVYKITS